MHKHYDKYPAWPGFELQVTNPGRYDWAIGAN